MASPTLVTPTKTDAASDVVTIPAKIGLMWFRKIGNAYKLLIRGKRNLAATPMRPKAMLIGTQRTAEIYIEGLTLSGLFSEDIAWMMYCVENIAPTLAMIHAAIVDGPIFPSHVK